MIFAYQRNYYKWLGIIAFCLGTVALILTFSRGGLLAFALSITIFIFVSWYRGWLPLLVPIVLVIATVLVALCFHKLHVNRILGDDDEAALSRIPLMKLALQIIVANPLLGVGVNNFTIIMKDYITSDLRGM
jgi:O-antigen ligase